MKLLAFKRIFILFFTAVACVAAEDPKEKEIDLATADLGERDGIDELVDAPHGGRFDL